MITITNTAILPATGLSLTQTFPWGEETSSTLSDGSSAFPNLPGVVTVSLTPSANGVSLWPGTAAISGGSGDLTSGNYFCWCNDFYTNIDASKPYGATPVSSLSLGIPWDKINYLFNTYTTNDMNVQVALWLLLGTTVNGFSLSQVESDIGTRYGPIQPSSTAIAMYNDANTNGAGFVPGPGQLVAVDLVIPGIQSLIIELRIPDGKVFEPTKTYLNPEYAKACAAISGPTRKIGPTPLANAQNIANPSILTLPAPFNVLNPGETIIITMPIDLYNLDNENVTIVFDSMVFANEIPPWEAPIGLASLPVGNPTGLTTPLWNGYVLGASALFGETAGHFDYGTLPMWFVHTPILRMQLQHPNPVMTLDPEPVTLIAGETTITSADVALVRNAVVGLAPYDMRMDCNGNGKVDVSDLMQYKAAAGM